MIDMKLEPTAPFASFEEATVYLEGMCRRMGVRHLSYWCVSLDNGSPDQVTWISTYDPAYMTQYMHNMTPLGDPAFEMESPLIDWADVISDGESMRTMQLTAAKYGITKYGLSYPMADGDTRRIMFSVNVNCRDADWESEKSRLANPLRLLAQYFHCRAKPLVESRRPRAAA